VFVVPGSEAVALVGDEGWEEVEQAFFEGGAILDHNLSLLPPRAPRRPLWLWAVTAAAVLAVTVALLI
jgi:hypothetical protein